MSPSFQDIPLPLKEELNRRTCKEIISWCHAWGRNGPGQCGWGSCCPLSTESVGFLTRTHALAHHTMFRLITLIPVHHISSREISLNTIPRALFILKLSLYHFFTRTTFLNGKSHSKVVHLLLCLDGKPQKLYPRQDFGSVPLKTSVAFEWLSKKSWRNYRKIFRG